MEVTGMQVDDDVEIIERVAALDIGKAEVVCCVRVPGAGRRRTQEVRTVTTMTSSLLALGDWLAEQGVTRVVMEATSDYWRAPFYLLEDRFQAWLVNAKDVKHLPGGRRRIGWTRCGCARSPNARCCGRVSSRHHRSVSCGT
jgi:hypothetical protein